MTDHANELARSSDEIKQDLDLHARAIGKLHHEKVCLEASIQNHTKEMHGLILELAKSEGKDVNLA